MTTRNESRSVPTIYICYAREDEPFANKLQSHLRLLENERLVNLWRTRSIMPDIHYREEFDTNLEEAQIILLLVSPDFIASDYCYSSEMQRALERHQAGEAFVVPVILRPVLWQETPLGSLQALPIGARPITMWHDMDDAFSSITEEIGKIAEERFIYPGHISTNPELRSSEVFDSVPAISFSSSSADKDTRLSIWKRRYSAAGKLFLFLRLFGNALDMYEKALLVEPENPRLYLGKGTALLGLMRSNEALAAYTEALSLAPDLSLAYRGQGKAYEQRAEQTYQELKQQAHDCHEKARELGAE